jgi:hypothetical protein
MKALISSSDISAGRGGGGRGAIGLLAGLFFFVFFFLLVLVVWFVTAGELGSAVGVWGLG